MGTLTRSLEDFLVLLRAGSQTELVNCDRAGHRIRLGRRPHRVALEPKVVGSLEDCPEHRTSLGRTNPHVIVTKATKTRRTTASVAYLSYVLDHVGVSIRTLCATRITDLLAALDLKVVTAVLGLDTGGVLP